MSENFLSLWFSLGQSFWKDVLKASLGSVLGLFPEMEVKNESSVEDGLGRAECWLRECTGSLELHSNTGRQAYDQWVQLQETEDLETTQRRSCMLVGRGQQAMAL